MTESSNGLCTGINGDENSFLIELLSFLLNHWLSRGLFCKDMDDCWPTKDSWDGLMTELFNGGGTYITGDEKSLLFELLPLILEHRLSWGVVCCLPWFSPVPLLWQQPIPFRRGMMNAIWGFGGVVFLLFCLLIAIKIWEPTFWRDKCSHVWVSEPVIKFVTRFLSQYHPD